MRTCIVTGSASGIGLALAERLSCDDWSVIGIDRQDHPPALAARIEPLKIDLLDSAALADLLAGLGERRVTALVHSAGVMRADDNAETRREGGAGLWQLHVGAAEALARATMPGMPEGEGRVVFVGSRAADGRAGRALYAASKAALTGLCRSLAAEHIGRGLTVNVVAPGTTDTPMLADSARRESPVMMPPLGRRVRPQEVAALIAFLIGQEAGAITGQTIRICGGASIAGIPPG
jgi:NAD(P)-dependent dehydrogenase (short-subunit alcohol dehydrogenase family)